MRWSAGAACGDDFAAPASSRSGSASACHGGVDLLVGVAAGGHGLCHHSERGHRPDVPLPRRGLRLQASGRRPARRSWRGCRAVADPRVLVGADTADDAGVVRISDELALVQTVDFFTPIVDDPYDFGRIAATNALSRRLRDGRRSPSRALNLVAFPLEALGRRRAAARSCAAARRRRRGRRRDRRRPLDRRPRAEVRPRRRPASSHPDAVLTNAGGRPGDALVLTKPLGAGVVATAVKRGLADDELLARAVEVMTTLNAAPPSDARAAGAHALTDVTGFGLLGHLHELALASGVRGRDRGRGRPGDRRACSSCSPTSTAIAGGTRRNRAHAETFTTFGDGVAEPLRWLVCDAMTSGGLLAAVPPGHAAEGGGSMPGARVGRLVDGAPGTISVC